MDSEGAASAPDEAGAVLVSVTGPVTLAEAPRWREALLAAFAAGAPVRIDLAGAGPWDLAGLQLLVSAFATGRRSGQAVRFARVPRVLLEIADRAGLAEHLAGAVEGRLP